MPKPLSGGMGRSKLVELMRNVNVSQNPSSADDASNDSQSVSAKPNPFRRPETELKDQIVKKTGTKGAILAYFFCLYIKFEFNCFALIGTPVQVSTNYIRLKTKPETGVFEYHVTFAPNVDARALRNRLLHQHKSVIGPTKTFDGTTLYLPFRLPENRTRLISEQAVDPTQAPIEYTVEIIFRRQQPMRECIHLYNVIFGRIMKELNLVRFGRKNFDPTAPTLIPQHKLEVWPGKSLNIAC